MLYRWDDAKEKHSGIKRQDLQDLLREEWRALSPDEQFAYEELARQDARRFSMEMKALDKSCKLSESITIGGTNDL